MKSKKKNNYLHERKLDRTAVGIRPNGQIVARRRLFRAHLVVVQIRLRQFIQQHVAENAVFAEHILALQIRPRRPFMYHDQQLVAPFLHKRADIELRRVVRALAVPDERAVEKDVDTRRRTEEIEQEHLVRLFDVEEQTVHAARHFFGQLRRTVVEGVGAVDICRVFKARALPCGRHVYALETDRVGIERLGQIGKVRVVFEIPFARKHAHLVGAGAFFLKRRMAQRLLVGIRDRIGAPGLAVHFKCVEITVMRCVYSVSHFVSSIALYLCIMILAAL